MTNIIEKIIRQKIGEQYSLGNNELHLLKYSTSASPTGLGNKVIFFAFKGNQQKPFVVVKTVRKYEDAHVIQAGFDCLKKIEGLVKNSEYEDIVPKGIFLYDDGKEIIFSVETACQGEKGGTKHNDIDFIVERYNKFQKHISNKHTGVINDVYEYTVNLVDKFDLPQNNKDEIIGYLNKLNKKEGFSLPLISQHGDMTPDNVFVGNNNICLVDCDRFGEINLPGLDIFRLVWRYDRQKIRKYLSLYFQDLDIKINNDEISLLMFVYFLHEFWIKKRYLLDNSTGKSIIDRFESEFKTTNLVYISRIKFLSDKANVYNTTKTCEALNRDSELKVTLVSTDNLYDRKEFFEKHSISFPFEITSLNSLSNLIKESDWRILNWLETLLINISLTKYLIINRKNIDIMYTRDAFLLFPALVAKFLFRKKVFFEVHAVLRRRISQALNKLLAKISDGVVAITHGLEEYYRNLNKNIMVSFCTAVEPERFSVIKKDKQDLRRELGFPSDKTIIGYTGNLWRTGNNISYGLEYIIDALPLLDKSIIFVGVGRKRDETKELEEQAKKLGVSDRVSFFPWVQKNKIAEYILSFDVLIVPSAGARIGNSPTKMFEYLASGRPIVAANTRAIAEVLHNEQNALLVDYKNPKEWSRAIMRALQNSELSKSLTEKAQKDSLKYSWDKRGDDIRIFIKNN